MVFVKNGSNITVSFMRKTAPSEKKMKVLLFRSFTDVIRYCEKSRVVYYFQ